MSLKAPTNALAEFLTTQKDGYLKALEEGKGKEWTVVMGNEAGDLDSLASAIAYSWYSVNIEKQPAVSLFQVTREDLALREENLYALSLAGIDNPGSQILCLDDLPTTTPFPSNKFVLVDHNRLGERYAKDNTDHVVRAVVDHHEDEGLYKDTADPRVIQVPTGSATSLVAHILEEKCPELFPPELATLLFTGILIDTNGLKVGGKAEDRDRASATFLAPKTLLTLDAAAASSSPLQDNDAIKSLNKTLRDKKSDVSRLSTRDLLRRDYKEYSYTPSWDKEKTVLVGLSSVPVGFRSWIPRDNEKFFDDIEKWMGERNLNVLGILTSYKDDRKKLFRPKKPKHKREELFVVRKLEGDEKVKGLAKTLFGGLKDSKVLDLKKKTFKGDFKVKKNVGFDSGFEGNIWRQRNAEANRKIVAPLVKELIEGPSANGKAAEPNTESSE